MDEDERSFEGEAGAPAERVVALPVEGATQAPKSDERSFEGEAPTALPVEGATQAPIIAEDWGKGLRVYSDDDDDRNRFLTLAMGECWHDFDTGCPVLTCKGGGFICGTCRDFVIANNDFGTEEDFAKLWEWANTVPELRRVLEGADKSSFLDMTGRRAFAERVCEVLRTDRRKQGG